MPLENWLAFSAATVALLAVPGPVVVLLFSQTIAHGRSIAAGAIPGVMLGDLVAMVVSLAGAGAVLAASPTLFTALKIAGAAYLVYLGIGLWRTGFGGLETANLHAREGTTTVPNRWRAFRQAFIVTTLNPKDIVFFVAFLPQFVHPDRSIFPQLVLIVTTFTVLVAISTSLWVSFGDRLRSGLTRPIARIVITRIGSAALIGAAAFTGLAS